MRNLNLPAPGKLNLSLNLLPRTGERGYYQVRFVNVQVELHDRVQVSLQPRSEGPGTIGPDSTSSVGGPGGTTPRSEGSGIIGPDSTSAGRGGISLTGSSEGSRDLAYRAAALMADEFDINQTIRIHLDKNIPVRAGLGGGSADAAAVINALDRLLGLNLSDEQKIGIASRLGMDVCYCVIGGLCAVGRVGDRVKRLKMQPPQLNLLIATPEERKPSTAWAYGQVDRNGIGRNLELVDELLLGIRDRDNHRIASSLHNDFEPFVGGRYPVVFSLKQTLLELGALGAVMAGSGLSVFGIFERAGDMEEAGTRLKSGGARCVLTRVAAGRP
jgi:4-diphosphocytidyl-2-C-methyl-D-erythritol kinase